MVRANVALVLEIERKVFLDFFIPLSSSGSLSVRKTPFRDSGLLNPYLRSSFFSSPSGSRSSASSGSFWAFLSALKVTAMG